MKKMVCEVKLRLRLEIHDGGVISSLHGSPVGDIWVFPVIK